MLSNKTFIFALSGAYVDQLVGSGLYETNKGHMLSSLNLSIKLAGAIETISREGWNSCLLDHFLKVIGLIYKKCNRCNLSHRVVVRMNKIMVVPKKTFCVPLRLLDSIIGNLM